jgi:hypothetical protein
MLGKMIVSVPDVVQALVKRYEGSTIVAFVLALLGVLAPVSLAQAGGNLPVIRTEAREVLVPTWVETKYGGGYYEVLRLNASDFHLLEDDKEQKIKNATLEQSYLQLYQDNAGFGIDDAGTPNGKWTRLDSRLYSLGYGIGYYYVIAYEPPSTAEGSCHQIKIKVDPKDISGNRFTTAQFEFGIPGVRNAKVEVDRRNVLTSSRTEYCATEHPSSDPLFHSKISKRMEGHAAENKSIDSRLSLRAADFYNESPSAQVRFVLDYPSIVTETGIPSFIIALLGLVYGKDGSLAARFTDSFEAGCWFDDLPPDTRICREHIPNHYETQVRLPPGEYDLRMVMSYNGHLLQTQVLVSVEAHDDKHLAVSGIALSTRFHQHSAVPRLQPQDKTLAAVPVMRFELPPLLSKGIEFTPTGQREFKKKEPLIAYFEIYEPLRREAGAATAQFEMRITDVKTGELKTDTGLRPADSFIQPGKTIIPIAEQIAISELLKGEYRLEVRASDSAGNHTDWRAAFFTVE